MWGGAWGEQTPALRAPASADSEARLPFIPSPTGTCTAAEAPAWTVPLGPDCGRPVGLPEHLRSRNASGARFLALIGPGCDGFFRVRVSAVQDGFLHTGWRPRVLAACLVGKNRQELGKDAQGGFEPEGPCPVS
uniref:Uncharacterized protein n=1 Tax=Rangifer tarandus platyrhynchus TaxID=3082113 RepID=A0ACB0EE21_RANTA|nr:unnamed protein product [Rangifer tarandus platyrhynchus]